MSRFYFPLTKGQVMIIYPNEILSPPEAEDIKDHPDCFADILKL